MVMLGPRIPYCGQDSCETFAEQYCQRCGTPRCLEHTARCIHCTQLRKDVSRFCFPCAQTHEAIKATTCVREWNAIVASAEGENYDYMYPKDFEALQQMRIERYKKMGFL